MADVDTAVDIGTDGSSRRMNGNPYGGRRGVLKAGLALALLPAITTRAAAGGLPLVLAFGDSLTAGYQLRPAESFPAQLAAALRREGVPATVHNAGVSGDTSAQGRARLAWVLKALPSPPAVAIVALGANDMLRGQPPAAMRDNLDAILTTLKAGGSQVVLAGMRAAPNLGRSYAREYEAVFPFLAKRHGVRLYPFFLEGVAANPRLLLADGMHPNAAGVAVMVNGILPLVRAALADSTRTTARTA
jgi:acyl-CoA thioesterase-1